jgi:hypothetical protein
MQPNSSRLPLAAMFAVALLLGAMPAANSQSDDFIPVIQFSQVPLTVAIQSFCRQARLNYLIDPKLFASPAPAPGQVVAEPSVTLTWTNLTASAALTRLLKEHNLVAVQDEFTTVTLITGTNRVAKVVAADLLDSEPNPATPMTNGVIPLIYFADVPLDEALKNLIDHAHFNLVLDPTVSGYVDPNDPTIHKFHNPPLVSLRWENLTARQAIVALCENYELVIVKDSTTGGVRIKPRNESK